MYIRLVAKRHIQFIIQIIYSYGHVVIICQNHKAIEVMYDFI